jgi:hypothetical protein
MNVANVSKIFLKNQNYINLIYKYFMINGSFKNFIYMFDLQTYINLVL